MDSSNRWTAFTANYRSLEMAIVARWVSTGQSGSVVGLAGCGKSNFLGFICNFPNVFHPYLGTLADRIYLIHLDLNGLPDKEISTIYRTILRSFSENAAKFENATKNLIVQLFEDFYATSDPFVSQTALRKLLFHLEEHGNRCVFVIDQFDRLSKDPFPELPFALRSLRDSFKYSVVFLIGMRQPPKYWAKNASFGVLYKKLDTNICWIGALNYDDSQMTIAHSLYTNIESLDQSFVSEVINLAGGIPTLLKSVAQLKKGGNISEPQEILNHHGIQHRLKELWLGLTPAEQETISFVANIQKEGNQIYPDRYMPHLNTLVDKKLIYARGNEWEVKSTLFASYVKIQNQENLGEVWHNQTTDEIFKGHQLLDNLTPTEERILLFFLKNPQVRLTKSEIILGSWNPKKALEVADENLAQQISNLRSKIEINASHPRYIITWRGSEGGYQFFSEGKPEEE